MKNNRLDLVGQRFGKLTVVEYAGTKTYKNGNKFSQWLCKCDCGGTKIALGVNLKKGTTLSCGCLIKEAANSRKPRKPKHGFKGERLYGIWKGMKRRCSSSDKHYGGRGVRVCEEWEKDYTVFREWALKSGYDCNAKRGECTLDRIDVNGDYCPENCRWVNQTIQMNNTRVNKKVTFNGMIKTLYEWSKVIGINHRLLYSRIFIYHMDVEDAFTKTVGADNTRFKSRYRLVEYDGQEKSIIEWAELYGMNPDTLWARLFKMNWSIEDALTKPIQNHSRKKKENVHNGTNATSSSAKGN